MKNKKGQAILGNFVLLLIFLISVLVGGLLAGIIYYQLNVLNTAVHTINFQIPIMNNQSNDYNITDFQSILGYTLYPLLGLRTAIPYLTYFMVFAFVIALMMTAYVSSKNGVFFVLHILITLLITYFAIILSNVYIKLLENTFINQMMVEFTIYNKLMIYLPAVVFFTSLVFASIAFVNLMKQQSNDSNNQSTLNYGGDY